MSNQTRFKQPELWGPWYPGNAKTISGNIWWYEKDRKRYPLMPKNPTTEPPTRVDEKSSDA